MSIQTKLCNLCRAELKVPLDTQIVQCPACGSVNGYGYGRLSTTPPENHPNAPPHNMNVSMFNSQSQQEESSNNMNAVRMPNSQSHQIQVQTPQGSRPLFPLGWTKPLAPQGQVSLRPVKTNTSLQQQPQASSPQGSPLSVKIDASFQQSPQGSPVKGKTFSQQSPQTSLPQDSPRPIKTSSVLQQPTQTSSPQDSPRLMKTNNVFQQPAQSSSPQGSPHLAYQSSPPQGSPRPVNFSSPFRPSIQSSPPQGSPHTPNGSIYPFQTPSPQSSFTPVNKDNYQQQQTTAQVSPQPTHQLQPSPPQVTLPSVKTVGPFRPQVQTISPQSPPQGSPHPAHYNNGYYQQPFQKSSPQSSFFPTNTDNNHNQQQQTSQVPFHQTPNNNSHQQEHSTHPEASLQAPSAPVPVVQPSPHLSPPRKSNGWNQQPFPTTPQVSSTQLQLSLGVPRVLPNKRNYYQPLVPEPPVYTTWEDQGVTYATYAKAGGRREAPTSASTDHQKFVDSSLTTAVTDDLTAALTYGFSKISEVQGQQGTIRASSFFIRKT